MSAPHLVSLPADILSKIVAIAADDVVNTTAALQLCMVSHLFHESAARRLYHSLRNISQNELEAILHISVKLRPEIGAWVRVLTLQACSSDLISEAFAVFTRLLAFATIFSATLDPACVSPTLHRFIQVKATNIPLGIASNLTHLYCAGNIHNSLLELISRKESFGCLTHLIMEDLSLEITFPSVFNLLQENGPDMFPGALEVLVLVIPRMNYHYLTSTSDAQEVIIAVLKADERVIIWDDDSDSIPPDWKRPFSFDYSPKFHLFDDALGLLPDGVVGLWESAELWVEKAKTDRQEEMTS
ncbi:hypothetical protein DL96DRAFT_1629468 [Flagelloscypha sp. PMI_526]|nr:hypothetical protein DL96DRAFT_1629468 [Flagelloscypha sp. PMI_526]